MPSLTATTFLVQIEGASCVYILAGAAAQKFRLEFRLPWCRVFFGCSWRGERLDYLPKRCIAGLHPFRSLARAYLLRGKQDPLVFFVNSSPPITLLAEATSVTTLYILDSIDESRLASSRSRIEPGDSHSRGSTHFLTGRQTRLSNNPTGRRSH